MEQSSNKDSQASTEDRPRKRRRNPLACTVCRDRKSRCSAELPHCSFCVRKGLQESCVYEKAYDEPSHIPKKTRKYIKELEDKIASLESQINVSRELKGDDQIVSDGVPRAPGIEEPRWDNSDSSISKDSIDALGTVSLNNGDDSKMYGDSSTIAFLSRITEATQVNDRPPIDGAPTSVDDDMRPKNGDWKTLELRGSQSDPNAFILPPREIADEFLNCYCEFIHPLFPVIHISSFRKNYLRLWKQPQPTGSHEGLGDNVFHSILNIMFALGCQYSTSNSPARRGSQADLFYQRSRALLTFEILDSMQLSLVQVHLLNGIYLQSTKHASRCWNSVGLAIRVAYIIGLHLDGTTKDSTTQLQAEIRCRLWHVCLTMDRLLAMTFGRPTTIPSSHFTRRPALIDDEYLMEDGEGSQPRDEPSRMGLFVFSSDLFQILHDILSKLYIQNPSRLGTESWTIEGLSDVLGLNLRLDKFRESLPTYLQPESTAQINSPEDVRNHTTLQSRVLECRFLYTRILLLRPVILATAYSSIASKNNTNASQPTLLEELSIKACSLCVETAHLLISRLKNDLDSNYRSPAWHSVYFTFAAMSVLFAAHLCPRTSREMDMVSFEASWDRCLQILDNYKGQARSASLATTVLWDLRNRIYPLPNLAHATIPPSTAPIDWVTHQASLTAGPMPNSVPSMIPQDVNFGNMNDLGTELGAIDPTYFNQQFYEVDWLQNPYEQDCSYLDFF